MGRNGTDNFSFESTRKYANTFYFLRKDVLGFIPAGPNQMY